MITLGLTGSIGMGKSTTAGFFKSASVPVWDADAAVHALYAAGGAGCAAIGEKFPDVVTELGVDRAKLRAKIAQDPGVLKQIERIIHPLVAQDRADFLAQNQGSPLVVFDIPLLFETGADAWLDQILVVTAPPEVQRDRVLARGSMSVAEFEMILAKQVPDAEKRAKADHVIDTSYGLEAAQNAVNELIHSLQGQGA